MSDWFDTTDDGLLSFATPFSSKISATPTVFSLTAANATQYAAARADYAGKLAIAKDPATKGPLATANKNSAKAVLIDLTRRFAAQVQHAMIVNDSQRAELGLPIHKTEPTPIGIPGTVGMSILSVTANTVLVRFFDPANPTRKAKVFGTQGFTVMSFVGANPPPADGPWKFAGQCTTDRISVVFTGPEAVAGAKVWITCMAYNPRGQCGFACAPQSTTLQAGAVIGL